MAIEVGRELGRVVSCRPSERRVSGRRDQPNTSVARWVEWDTNWDLSFRFDYMEVIGDFDKCTFDDTVGGRPDWSGIKRERRVHEN